MLPEGEEKAWLAYFMIKQAMRRARGVNREKEETKMSEPKWLAPDRLCSFGEKVRVEHGPQIVEMPCTDENLSDRVTAPHYRIGRRDAYGRFIRPWDLPESAHKSLIMHSAAEEEKLGKYGVLSEDDTMAVVDWDCKHKPWEWKVYQLQETDQVDTDGRPRSRFVQVGAHRKREAALAAAAKLAEEM